MPSLLTKTLLVGSAAIGIAAQQASATLTIDLRAASVDGIPSADAKNVVALPGQTVTFDVYAIVTGATEAPGLEGFQIAIGSILSGSGGALGNVLTNEFAGPFGGPGSTLGLRADLDLDGDMDIGSNATGLTNDFIGARSSGMTAGNANGLGASEFKFYTFTFQAGAGGNTTSVNWRKTDLTGLTTEYIWQENGVLTNSRGVNGGSVPLIQLGPQVLVVVPEPSAFGMVLMGALGIVGFRRLGFRRS